MAVSLSYWFQELSYDIGVCLFQVNPPIFETKVSGVFAPLCY